MTVASILKAKGNAVHTVAPGRMLQDAAAMLSARRIGALVVVDERGRVAGVLSERDIVEAIARNGHGALAGSVSDHMLKDFSACTPQDSLEHLMSVMTNRRVRHLPVLDGGRLAGLVSIGDVVKHKIAEAEMELETIKDYIGAQ